MIHRQPRDNISAHHGSESRLAHPPPVSSGAQDELPIARIGVARLASTPHEEKVMFYTPSLAK